MDTNAQSDAKVALIVLDGDDYSVKLQGITQLEALALFQLAARGIEEQLKPRAS